MILTASYFDSYFKPLSYDDSNIIADLEYSFDASGDRCVTSVECYDTTGGSVMIKPVGNLTFVQLK